MYTIGSATVNRENEPPRCPNVPTRKHSPRYGLTCSGGASAADPSAAAAISASSIPENRLLNLPIRPVSSSISSSFSCPGLQRGLLCVSRVRRMTLRGDVDQRVYVEPSVRMTSCGKCATTGRGREGSRWRCERPYGDVDLWRVVDSRGVGSRGRRRNVFMAIWAKV